jgi:hypothetical protein
MLCVHEELQEVFGIKFGIKYMYDKPRLLELAGDGTRMNFRYATNNCRE